MDEHPDVPAAGPDASTSAPPAVPSPPDHAAANVVHPMAFTGDGWEYFRIWIVNVALTIVTLGVYSAWAKVRRLQYFYRNTQVAGTSFDYHGDPIAIFKGRLIAGFLFFSYTIAGFIHPLLAVTIAIGIAALMPWMLARSLRFRLHNSSYRGLRFRFHGSTPSAYWVFLALPIFTVFTLGALAPFWHHRMKRYQANNASYGQMPFAMDAPVSAFYVTYLIGGALLMVGVGAMFGIIASAVAAAVTTQSGGDPNEAAMTAITALAGLVAAGLYILTIYTVQSLINCRIHNVVWNHNALGRYRFHSTMSTAKYLWISLTNVLAIIATVGLFWPFAQVRLAAYQAGTFAIEGPGSFEEFQALASAEEAAVGEELAEFFDFDIAF